MLFSMFLGKYLCPQVSPVKEDLKASLLFFMVPYSPEIDWDMFLNCLALGWACLLSLIRAVIMINKDVHNIGT